MRLVVALAVIAAASGAAAEPPAEAPPFTLASLGIKGTLTYKLAVYPDTTPNDSRHVHNEGILEVEWARRLTPWLDLKLVGVAQKDDDDFDEGVTFQIPDTSLHRSILELEEAVARVGRGAFDVSAGKQIFAWGTAEGFNPVDNLNAWDFIDPLDGEKIGAWSVAARATFGPANAIVAIVPVFTPSRLPLADSRWTPTPPAGVGGVLLPRQLPPTDIGSTQYAARVRATLAGWDLALSYYDGFDSTPVFRMGTVDLGGINVQSLTPVFTRVHIPAFDFSTTFKKLEVHGETVFRFVSENGRDNRFQWIGGVTYTWDIGRRWLDQINLVFEYAREATMGRVDSSIAPFGSTGQVGDLLAPNAFRNAPFVRVLFKIDEDTQVRLLSLVDLQNKASGYAQIRLTRRLTDRAQVQASYDILWGEPTTFWGRWANNDRFFLTLKAYF
jgi:hypothetical protein